MTMRSITAAFLGGTVLAALLAPTGAAYAASHTVDDATGDVWEPVWNSETETVDYLEAGSLLNVDVDKVVVVHTDRRIVVTTTYAELKKQEITLAPSSRMRFNDGPAVGMMVDTWSKWSGESVLYKKSGMPIRCAGFDHTIDYTANTVQLSVPRSCVGNPRWVEVNYVGLGNVEDPEVESGYRNYEDTAHTSASGWNGWSARVKRG